MIDKAVKQIAYIWLILICALYLLSPLFPDMRLWGINHLKFADSIAIALAAIFTAAAFLPQFRDGFHQFVNRMHSGYHSVDKGIRLGFSFAIFVISIAMFYIFRTTVHLLGDGYLRGDEIRAGFSRLSLPTEPLDSIIHWLLFKVLGPLTGWGVHQAFELSSALIGGFFVLAILNLTRPSEKPGFSPILIFLGLGGVFFYFGYEESYSLLFMGLLIYLVYAYRFLKGDDCFGRLTIAFTLTFFTHFSSLYILPSYLFMVFVAIKERQIGRKRIVLSLLSLLIMAVGFIYLHYIYRPVFFTEHTGFLLPFGFDNYKLLSPAHLLDTINNYLLSGTLAVMLMPLVILTGAFRGLSRGLKIFVIILIIQSIGFVLLFDPKLGLARDWDLFSSSGLLAVFAIYVFCKENKEISRKFGGILRTAVLVVLIFTVSYIGINSSYNRSIERFEDILRFYDQRSAYGYESLGGQYRRYYRGREDLYKAIESYKIAFRKSPNPRYMLDISSTFDVFYHNYQDRSIKRIFIDSISHYASRALALDSTSIGAHDLLATAQIYGGDLNRAAEIYERLLRFESEYDRAYLELGRINYHQGNAEAAQYYLNEYLKRVPDSESRGQIEELLRKLR